MEDEILGQTPEDVPAAAPDPSPAGTNNMESETPVDTGLPETPQDHYDGQNGENHENNSETSSSDDEENESSDQGSEEDKEEGDGSGVTNVTVIHPPARQIFYNYNVDVDAIYRSLIENDESSPVPVLVTGSLIEKDPGIMDKRLEDYSVTEALLLLILITLWLRMVFDYLGRRRS